MIPPLTSASRLETHQGLNAESPLSSSYHSIMAEYEGSAAVSSVSYGNGFKRDLWAAVLFLLNIFCITWLAVQAYYASNSAPSGTTTLQLGISPSFGTAIVALSIVIPIFGYMWLSFMISHAESLIEFVMMSNVVICGVISVFTLLSGQLIGHPYVIVCEIIDFNPFIIIFLVYLSCHFEQERYYLERWL